jgi:hypothetical protein
MIGEIRSMIISEFNGHNLPHSIDWIGGDDKSLSAMWEERRKAVSMVDPLLNYPCNINKSAQSFYSNSWSHYF